MIIGICGDIGSGKDTVADLLIEEFGFARASFAGPLKEWVLSLVEPLGVEHRHIFGTQADKVEPLLMLFARVKGVITTDGSPGQDPVPWTGRALLEYFGTDVGRNIHPDIWVKRMVNNHLALKFAFGTAGRTVVPDVRFANEFAAIRELGGEIWRTHLVVPHTKGCGRALIVACTCGSIETTGHVSDNEWRTEQFDRILKAPKPGVTLLQEQARLAYKELPTS